MADEVLYLRVPAELKKALEGAARADDRSVNWLAVKVFEEWLSGKGWEFGPRGERVTVVDRTEDHAGGSCLHPKDREVKLSWGVKCGVCDSKIR